MKLAQWYIIFLPIERCGLIREADLSHFDATRCGDTCQYNPLTMTRFYCEKGETCCPDGAYGQKCSKKCGAYNAKSNISVYLILSNPISVDVLMYGESTDKFVSYSTLFLCYYRNIWRL